MEQNYEIFINGSPLIISSKINGNNNVIEYRNKKDLHNIIREMECTDGHPGYTIVHADATVILYYFSRFYTPLLAAGGLIWNEKDEVLMIYRYSKWDLPKGKMEENENPGETALREVEEECGISRLKIIGELGKTYHTFIHGKKRILKETLWFEMMCADPENIRPQTEESIEEVRWMNREQVTRALQNSYPNIRSLLTRVLYRIST